MQNVPLLSLPTPLGIFNRLEPRPCQEDFQQSLRAEVHDALWMLTRQWQFGEFKGEDTGTAILAEVGMEYARLTRAAFEGQPAQLLLKQGAGANLDDLLPPEALAESEPVPFNSKTHLKWSLAWRKLLLAAGCPADTFGRFVQAFPLLATTNEDIESDPQQKQWYAILGGKVMDAKAFYERLNSKTGVFGAVVPPITDMALTTKIAAAAGQMKTWCEGLFCQPSIQTADVPNEPPGWKGDSMRYVMGMAALKTPTKREVYVADHSLGDMDWYSFDVATATDPVFSDLTNLTNLANEPSASLVALPTSRFIPNPVQFPGMPASRFWEFENGRINLANLDVDASDLSKIMLAEFALVYSNDWQLLPFSVPFGSVCRITKIKMTDVFGGATLVPAENNDWSFFNLNHQNQRTVAYNSGLFLPSVIADLQESKPVELLRLIPSETDNLLWAIEDIIPDFLGEGISGEKVFARLKHYLQNLSTSDAAVDQATADFLYQLMQEIPEFQFPYLPDGTALENFKRATFNRQIDGVDDHTPISPKGIVLRQLGSQILNRSEVPNTGVVMTRTFQRTRWKDGRVVTWLGRKKTLGRPAATVPLLYDQLLPTEPSDGA